MFIPSYALWSLIAIAVLILFRQLFVAWRHDKENGIKIRLFRKLSKPKLETFDGKTDLRKRMIVDRTHQLGKITNNAVEAMFHVSHATAWKYLEELQSEGRLKQAGKTGRGVIYEPVIGAF